MTNRASFLAGLSAAAAVAPGAVSAQDVLRGGRRIDVHRHVSPPWYGEAVKAQFPVMPPPLAAWTPERCLADMDAAGIELGILSMPARPGMYFGDVAAARKLSRDANQYMADLRRQYPGRFGFFAALPLPDMDGTLAEIAYALDVLKADGVGVWTSYGKQYLGDAAFVPLWTELDRRRAIVYSHPTDAACCTNPVHDMSETVVEFGADTTRSIGSIVFSGTSARFPNVRVIFSHGGGTMPFLYNRFEDQAKNPKTAALLPNGLDHELRRFYYDTAFASTPEPMAALAKLVPVSQILLGSDHPYHPSSVTVSELLKCGLPSRDVAAIVRQSPANLLGRTA